MATTASKHTLTSAGDPAAPNSLASCCNVSTSRSPKRNPVANAALASRTRPCLQVGGGGAWEGHMRQWRIHMSDWHIRGYPCLSTGMRDACTRVSTRVTGGTPPKKTPSWAMQEAECINTRLYLTRALCDLLLREDSLDGNLG